MRRPAPLIAAPRARLAAYALLAGVGAVQWVRYVQGASQARGLLWVAVGGVAGLGILTATRLGGRRGTLGAVAAALGGLLLAVASSGLDLAYLLPRHWDELAGGIARGSQALNTVRLPYLGKDPWVLTTVELSGALLCWGAAVGATWPRGGAGPRLFALVLLLVLAASPVVSLGAARPVWLGLALAALTAAFLWLERLSRRPGIGFVALVVAAMAVAVPLGTAVDREEPWFDYKAFSENFSGGAPITFDWNHRYGPIDWPREGAEVMRVKSPIPMYWKADELTSFDGREWVAGRTDPGGYRPQDDLPDEWQRGPDWTERFTVALRRLRTPTVVGAGTILDVSNATRPVEPDVIPGRWIPSGSEDLSEGDSYTVTARVPRPTPEQLTAATVGRDPRRRGMLTMQVRYRPDALSRAPLTPRVPGRPRVPIDEATIAFRPFGRRGGPVASYRITGLSAAGGRVLESSFYDRTWALAKRLRRQATSPYDYVLRVNAFLRDARFRYSEVPPQPDRAHPEAPLEFFLFDSRLGYCQQYSGAMALLLRMGGIPARVATGFSPGGFRETTGEWIVRDTDAHSWVEAWFDGLGWVTFDPTPSQTPARSQIAAIEPTPQAPASAASPDRSTSRPQARRPEGLQREPIVASSASPNGGIPVLAWIGLGLAALLLAGATFAVRAGRRAPVDGDALLLELERALRRSGRATPAGTTLVQLERRLGASAEGAAYLRALRAARYGPARGGPTGAQRAAFRRELATGLGWLGRLRALWALPPRVYPVRRRPR